MAPNPQIARDISHENSPYHWLTAYAGMCKNSSRARLGCYTLGLAYLTTCVNFLRSGRTNRYFV